MNSKFLYELTLLRKDLHPVASAITHIDKSIVRNIDMDHDTGAYGIIQSAELFWRWIGRIVVESRTVIDFAQRDPIGSPAALEGPGVGVVHNDAPIHVAVGDVDLISSIVPVHVAGGGDSGGV